MKNPSKEQSETWRKDPNNWKCGVFYYNPEDERLLPPKPLYEIESFGFIFPEPKINEDGN